MIKPAIYKYNRFPVANNILLNKINIVHNATLHALALFSRAVRLYTSMNIRVSGGLGSMKKYFSCAALDVSKGLAAAAKTKEQ